MVALLKFGTMMERKQRLIIMRIIKEAYSGAQSSGKSTRINAVERVANLGFPIIVLPEYATIVAQMGYKLNKESGVETQFKMTEMQIVDEINAVESLKRRYPREPVGVIICDRPVYDSYVYGTIAYKDGRMTGQELSELREMIKKHVEKYPYDKVYFCEPREFYGNKERLQGHTSMDEAREFQKEVHNAFEKFYNEQYPKGFKINLERILK